MGFEGAKPLANFCLLSFRKKVEARRGLSDKWKKRFERKKLGRKGQKNKREKPRTQSARRQPGTKAEAARRPEQIRTKRRRTGGKSRTSRRAAAQPDTKAAGCPQAGNKAAEHRQKNAGAPCAKAATTAAGRAKTATPADGATHRAQKNPSEQAKLAFALLPARRGLVKPGRQKFASLFLAGMVFFCFAFLILLRIARVLRRAALHKRGHCPLLSPCKLFEKSLSKNFHEGPGAPRP